MSSLLFMEVSRHFAQVLHTQGSVWQVGQRCRSDDAWPHCQ
jgi:hypothetical protein